MRSPALTRAHAPTKDALGSGCSADPWQKSLRFLPWLAAAFYAFLGIRYLYRAHPNEDAFILFKYVENFAQGLGIVYYPGGPHAEGAIDFLWMMLLSGLRFLGMDVAVAACSLGAVGAGLASFLCCEAVRRCGVRGPAAFVFGMLSLSVVYLNSTLAGYLGFSTMFYAASFLALACLVLWAERALVWTPLLALALGLMRADAVVPGVLFVVLGFLRARPCGCARGYVLSSTVALLLGAAYFAWRFDYFELLLPLPLYVKSRQTQMLAPLGWLESTVAGPLRWVWDDPSLRSMALGALVLVALRWTRQWKPAVRQLAVFTPYLVHLVTLGFAQQTQNVAGRFQAPERLALLFLLVSLGVHAWRARNGWLPRAAALAACCVPLAHETYLGRQVFRNFESTRLYVDTFAPQFGRLLGPERVIALTEAGRLGFWTRARVEDTFGLNTPRTALAPPDQAYFDEISPDVMIFHAGLTNLKFALLDRTEAVVPISNELLKANIGADNAEIYRAGVSSYGSTVPGNVAAILMARFLGSSRAYDVYAVRYGDLFNHVYAIKKGLPEAARIVELLEQTTSGSSPYRSYAAVRHFPFAGDGAH